MPEPRSKLSLRIVIVAIAYVAIMCAAGAAMIHDRNRPDAFTGIFACGVAGNIIPRLMRGQGRILAAYWGFALTSLIALAAVLLFFGMRDVQVDATSGIFRALVLWFGLPWLAVGAGFLGAWLAGRRFDRRRPERDAIQPLGAG